MPTPTTMRSLRRLCCHAPPLAAFAEPLRRLTELELGWGLEGTGPSRVPVELVAAARMGRFKLYGVELVEVPLTSRGLMTALRAPLFTSSAPTHTSPTPAQTIHNLGRLRGEALFTYLQTQYRRPPTAAELGNLVENLLFLRIRLDDSGAVRFLNQTAPAAMAKAPPDDAISLFTRSINLGVPLAAVNSWAPFGWPKILPRDQQSPLFKDYENLRGWEQRLARNFPGAPAFAPPGFGSALVLANGGPVAVTVQGSVLELRQGSHSVSRNISPSATSAQLDAAVADLAQQLRRR